MLDTSKDGEVDIDEWEEAVHRGLAKRLEQLADERERRERAARAEDEAFSAEFLSMAREVFDMIDKDGSGSLDKKEVVTAIRTDKKVISFLQNCGNQNLQYLLVPARLEMALNTLDTDRDGEINAPEWESAIETALANKLEARAAQREAQAKAARKEIEEFTAEFLNAARQCFQMIDKDNSGTLTKTEIVKAVAEDKDVVKFLRTCGEDNLQFLLQPARLEKALQVLDTSKDGEVDIDEWEEAVHRGLAKRLEQLAEERERRDRAARADDEAFTAQFLNAAREVFLIGVPQRRARGLRHDRRRRVRLPRQARDRHGRPDGPEGHRLFADVRQRESPVPAGARAARAGARRSRHVARRRDRRRGVGSGHRDRAGEQVEAALDVARRKGPYGWYGFTLVLVRRYVGIEWRRRATLEQQEEEGLGSGRSAVRGH